MLCWMQHGLEGASRCHFITNRILAVIRRSNSLEIGDSATKILRPWPSECQCIKTQVSLKPATSDKKVLDTVYFQKSIKREYLAPE